MFNLAALRTHYFDEEISDLEVTLERLYRTVARRGHGGDPRLETRILLAKLELERMQIQITATKAIALEAHLSIMVSAAKLKIEVGEIEKLQRQEGSRRVSSSPSTDEEDSSPAKRHRPQKTGSNSVSSSTQ